MYVSQADQPCNPVEIENLIADDPGFSHEFGAAV